MACPAIPSLTPRSEAMGVSRLTGMNSEAISVATHKRQGEDGAPRGRLARRQVSCRGLAWHRV